jgi:hypothetical protein
MRILLAALALLVAGCAGGPGSFCLKDSECAAGLYCLAPAGSGRGLCTYPASSFPDGAPLEARPVEARSLEASTGDLPTSH